MDKLNNKSFFFETTKLTLILGVVLGGLTLLGVGAKALYYGSPTSKYEQSGYLIVKENNGQFGQCGVNFVSDKAAITAAHCLNDVITPWANTGTFRQDFQNRAPHVSAFSISPKYTKYDFSIKPGYADVGVIVFSESVKLPSYAKIASPREGCGYYLVGYGRNEAGGSLSRTGTDVCIKNMTDYSFELDFEGKSHFCNGDSGSGIYRKGTNEIVGVVSAYYTSLYSRDCKDAVAFIAARLDYNSDYLNTQLPPSISKDIDTTPEKTVPDDYFGEYHPETKKDDGTYNYNDEIQIEMEKLGEMFDQIYPEEELEGKQTPQTDSRKNDNDSNFFDDNDNEDMDYDSWNTDPNDKADTYGNEIGTDVADAGGNILFVALGLICCFGFFGILIVVLIVVFSKRNKVS